MKYYIEVWPSPKGNFFSDPDCFTEISWKWQIRETLQEIDASRDFTLGKIIAGGIEDTKQKAENRAKLWAKAFSDQLAYVYDGD